ncbi:MAG: biotin/lipoyl-binding protein [Actinomycetota bacterium]|nr:biotin/lipoyl-binding protein [Actinomycetota bacterium]
MIEAVSIRRVLVANRGEIARRVFASCRRAGIETVAVHSPADAEAAFVREADQAVALPGDAPSESYLRGDLIVAAARATGADAIHPGYGFLSESADFARLVTDAGLTWIGPDADTVEAMGSKVRAKKLMAEAGVPILEVDVDTVSDEQFPLLVKASAGGGGRGMRVVRGRSDLDAQLAAASSEAASAFGDGTVFVEPYLPTARHVEVQVLADAHGTCWIVGERDCSLQRRHQKVMEEAPAPALADGVRELLADAARAAVGAVGYLGAGTVEFLVQGESIYFLEMNTRLQVEHPVSECVYDVDLVAAQLSVAQGEALPPRDFTPRGHAIEVRLYAEDPGSDWAPQTGTVRAFDFPSATTSFEVPTTYGVRLDSAVDAGAQVGIHYDPMLAKVIAWGPDRASAARMLSDALRRARVHGVVTNAAVLRVMLNDPDVLASLMHTSLLEEKAAHWISQSSSSGQRRVIATAAALSDAAAATTGAGVQQRMPAAWRSVPSQSRTRSYLLGGDEVSIGYRDVGGLLCSDDDEVTAVEVGPDVVVLDVHGVRQHFEVSRSGSFVDVWGPSGSWSLERVPRFTDPAASVGEGSLVAPMPGAVVSLAVAQGDRVAAGDPLLVLEAMKMQHTIRATTDGVLSDLRVHVGLQVESGAVLAVIEPDSA